MASVAYALPIQPGKSQQSRNFASELAGPRKAEHHAQRKAHGFTSIRVWRQRTPQEMIIVCAEADDLDQALNNHATSNHPFDQWFKQNVQEITGLSLDRNFSAQPADLVLDWQS